MDYSQLLVKEYTHWLVQVHENQGYLGRCVVWCKREDANDLTEVTKDEYEELLRILKALKTAATNAFKTDWFNYAFLGNETPHLHGHFVPRYSSSREFMSTTFIDELWGHNYKTDKSFITTPELLEEVKLKLAEELSK